MITEDYVSLETAKLLKEKGFNEDIDLWYDENGEMFSCHKYNISGDWRVKVQQEVYLCPTLQMAMKWLKDAHRIHFEIEPYIIVGENDVYYNVKVLKQVFGDKYLFDGELVFKYLTNEFRLSYEQACEDAIKYCLENLI